MQVFTTEMVKCETNTYNITNAARYVPAGFLSRQGKTNLRDMLRPLFPCGFEINFIAGSGIRKSNKPVHMFFDEPLEANCGFRVPFICAQTGCGTSGYICGHFDGYEYLPELGIIYDEIHKYSPIFVCFNTERPQCIHYATKKRKFILRGERRENIAIQLQDKKASLVANLLHQNGYKGEENGYYSDMDIPSADVLRHVKSKGQVVYYYG